MCIDNVKLQGYTSASVLNQTIFIQSFKIIQSFLRGGGLSFDVCALNEIYVIEITKTYIKLIFVMDFELN